MGNTSSERAAMGHGEKAQRRDSRGIKDGERPKILMDSPEDADIFHGEDMKACNKSGTYIVTLLHSWYFPINKYLPKQK